VFYAAITARCSSGSRVVKRLLFVDDEPQILQGVKASLYTRRKDWDMYFATGGGQAIELLRESHFDVLVTDLRMPGIDGVALVARARSDSPDTIRVVLSGYADDNQSQRLVSLAHRYLSKPCESKQLEECIDRCLATQSLIQSAELRVQLGAVGALPPMPGTFAALQCALTDPNVDSRRVAAIIQKDPAISAKVLQVCNSAFFRLPRRVASIQQAVSYLGLSTVRSMVLSAELFQPSKVLSSGLDLEQMQRHALSVAAIARSLAADNPWAEDAFLAGLLHDVGFLLLARQDQDGMQRALQTAAAGMPLAQAEQQHMGINHGVAGGYLLGLWGLPYEIVETVAHHEEPARVVQSCFDVLSAVSIAHALLVTIRPGDVPPYEMNSPTLGDEYLRAIRFPHSWESLLERARALLGAEEPT
jgi:HD-like signal output (HDOD) protein/ActR/RegA family two-component response regulator